MEKYRSMPACPFTRQNNQKEIRKEWRIKASPGSYKAALLHQNQSTPSQHQDQSRTCESVQRRSSDNTLPVAKTNNNNLKDTTGKYYRQKFSIKKFPCLAYVRGQCARDPCKFSHDLSILLKEMQKECKYNYRCQNVDCLYKHTCEYLEECEYLDCWLQHPSGGVVAEVTPKAVNRDRVPLIQDNCPENPGPCPLGMTCDDNLCLKIHPDEQEEPLIANRKTKPQRRLDQLPVKVIPDIIIQQAALPSAQEIIYLPPITLPDIRPKQLPPPQEKKVGQCKYGQKCSLRKCDKTHPPGNRYPRECKNGMMCWNEDCERLDQPHALCHPQGWNPRAARETYDNYRRGEPGTPTLRQLKATFDGVRKCKFGLNCVDLDCETVHHRTHPEGWVPAGRKPPGAPIAPVAPIPLPVQIELVQVEKSVIADADSDPTRHLMDADSDPFRGPQSPAIPDPAPTPKIENKPQNNNTKPKEIHEIIDVHIGLKIGEYKYYSDRISRVLWEYRTKHVLKIVGHVSQITDKDLRAEYMQGSALKYTDPQVFAVEYVRTIERKKTGCCCATWEPCSKYWCGPELLEWRTRTCFSAELLSHVTTAVNLNLVNDNKTAWERINQTVRSIASVNLNRYVVLEQTFLSVGTALVCYFMMRLCKYQHRKADFQPLPQETQDALYMDTVLEKSSCLNCLSPKSALRLLYCVPVRECFGRLSSLVSACISSVPAIHIPTIQTIIPSWGGSENDLFQNLPNPIETSLEVSLDLSDDGLSEISSQLNVMPIQASNLGWRKRITLLGEKLNCCRNGNSLTDSLLIEEEIEQSTPQLSLLSKMKRILNLNTHEPLTQGETSLNVELAQFSS